MERQEIPYLHRPTLRLRARHESKKKMSIDSASRAAAVRTYVDCEHFRIEQDKFDHFGKLVDGVKVAESSSAHYGSIPWLPEAV